MNLSKIGWIFYSDETDIVGALLAGNSS